ncbi:MAG: hypothetical protein KGL95_14010, partial [Patescibacteria group bacterium]|nr:hypothetical protein [Patescibacteria group bacterium]
KTANVYAGLLGAIIFSFAGFSIATTKFIWNPYPIVWIMPLYFLALYLFSRQKPIGLPLVTFLTALIIHFEAIYGVCLLPTQAVVTVLWFIQKKPLKDKLKQGSLSLFLFILPLIPSMIFDLRHHFLITSSLWHAFSSGGNSISHGNIAPIPISQRIILRGMDLFKYSIDSLTPWTVINLLLTLTAGFGVYKLRNKQNNLLFILSFIVVVSPFFIFLLMKYYVWEHYWTGNAPFFAIVVSFALGKLLAIYSSRKTTLAFLGGSILLISAYVPWSILLLWKQGVLQPGEQVFSTQSKVVATVYAAAGKRPFSVYEETPPVYDFVYRYLFWWKGYTTYHRYSRNDKQPITFIIRETTPSDPDGIFFKAHVVHIQDAPVKTITFPGGPVLEEYERISPEPAVDPNYFPQI